MKIQLMLGVGLAWLTACHATAQETDTVAEISKAAVEDSPEDYQQTKIKEPSSIHTSAEIAVPEEVAIDLKDAEPAPPNATEASYPSVILRRGETLAHFARWSGTTIEEIAEASSVELDGRYSVGTEIILPISDETLALVASKRETHRVKRVDGYLMGRGGSERSEFYTVKTGDTAWRIAKTSHAIPVWLLEHYNPSVDLERLRPGQQLMVPVLADTVVDAE